jgi:excisionase family DNA binding protein
MSATAERSALSREEAAERLGVSLCAFEKHVQPRIRTIRVGRRILIPVAALERFLAGEIV